MRSTQIGNYVIVLELTYFFIIMKKPKKQRSSELYLQTFQEYVSHDTTKLKFSITRKIAHFLGY